MKLPTGSQTTDRRIRRDQLILPLLCFFLGSSTAVAAPSNDDFANAHTLTGVFDVHAGTTVDATRESGEPDASDFSTVWYKWTPARGGRARFSALPETQAFNYWRMSVWVGPSLGDLKRIAFKSNSGGEARIEDLPVSPGTQYYISIGHRGDSSNDQEAFDMSVVLPTESDLKPLNVTESSADNGLFINALPLSGLSNTVISYSRNFAQNEPGEPTRNPEYSSWYYYNAPENGRISLSVAGTELSEFYDSFTDRTIIAYNVDTYAEMVDASPVGTTSSGTGLPGTLSFNVIAGQRYYIAFGHGRFSNGSLNGTGSEDDTSWRVMTMSYSPLPPTLTTDPVSSITANSAMSGGEVTGENGASVTERGIVFGTRWLPSTSNGATKVVSGSGTGVFIGNLTGLSPSTTYAVRSYAINSAGTGYGPQVEFTTEASTTVHPPASSAAGAAAIAARAAAMSQVSRSIKKLKGKIKKASGSKSKKLKAKLKKLKKQLKAL